MNQSEEEKELLAKLEEQNRTFLSDSKAVTALPTRRREGSFSSNVSTESSSDGIKARTSDDHSTLSLRSLTLSSGSTMLSASATILEQWAYVVKNWEQFNKKRSVVADLIRKGLPAEFRPLVWRLYTGAYDSSARKLYESYLETDSPVENAIRRDIARTFPKHELFKDENGFGQESLFRVIKAYSIHDREVGYCQGSGFIVGILLMQLPELDAFAVLVQLMNEYRLREMYKPTMVELGVCMYQLEHLLAEQLPDIYTHFVSHSFAPSLYASAWFLTLFSTVLPLSMAIRVMDFFVVEGMTFIFRFALALLRFSSDKLLASDMETMVVYLQHEGPMQWERNASALFESANAIKINQKKMKKLEKEYLQMRSQEREDQIELRRLRTENGLLLQRIARLEEECATVADRLVQSQLIRAQESEAVLALRCELSILRRTQGKSIENDTALDGGGDVDQTQETTPNKAGQSAERDHLSLDKNLLPPPNINGFVESSEAVSSFVNGPSLSEKPASRRSSVAELELSEQIVVDVDPSSQDPTSTSNPLDRLCSKRSTLCHPPSGVGLKNGDSFVLATLHSLQSDLTLSRAREAAARSSLGELKTRYRELEELKTDQATRSSEQLAVLKDELFTAKLRETDALSRLDETRQRLTELETLWNAHASRCKSVSNDTKRGTLLLGSFGQSNSQSIDSVRKLSDGVLEARYLDQIAVLQQQVNELAVQRELADRRADRLDQRVTELLDARSASDSRERELQSELREAVQLCADIEAKRKADGVMWRSREMELTAQLTERRQSQLQLECKYESLLATRCLQASHCNGDSKCNGFDPMDYCLSIEQNGISSTGGPFHGSLDSLDKPNGDIACEPHHTLTRSKTLDQNPKTEVQAMWKDLPPTVMTDSIGPLEDLCLVPDDPLITSVYVGSQPLRAD